MKKRIAMQMFTVVALCAGLLAYLQWGRAIAVCNSRSLTSENAYILEVTLIANRICILDEEAFARQVIEQCADNGFREVRFSYDVRGYPNELHIGVYMDEQGLREKEEAFQIHYVQEPGYAYNIKEHPEKFTIEIERPSGAG